MVPLSFAGHDFVIAAPAALYWPEQKALIVADLHLEKASFYARQGQMLPPYDSQATLEELAELIVRTGAEKIFCLGDNYHDADGEARLEPQAARLLSKLANQLEWIWIVGNHDPALSARWGGTVRGEWSSHGLSLRHEARLDSVLPEISGHFHPKLRVPVRKRRVSRRCFVRGEKRLIMPAFGSLTGGMPATDPVIEAIVGGPAEVVIGLDDRAVQFPLPFAERQKNLEGQGELPLAIADG